MEAFVFRDIVFTIKKSVEKVSEFIGFSASDTRKQKPRKANHLEDFPKEHPYIFASVTRAAATPLFQFLENQRALKRGYDPTIMSAPPSSLQILRKYGFSNVFKTGVGFQTVKGGVRELYRGPIIAMCYRDTPKSLIDTAITAGLISIGDAFANGGLDALSLTQLKLMAETGKSVPAYSIFSHVSPRTVFDVVRKNFLVSAAYSFVYYDFALSGGVFLGRVMPEEMEKSKSIAFKAATLSAGATMTVPIDNFRQEITGPNRKLYAGPSDAFTTLSRTKGCKFFFAGTTVFYIQNLITSSVMLIVLEAQRPEKGRE